MDHREVTTQNHGKKPITLNHLASIQKVMGYPLLEARMTEIHFKEDGTINDGPIVAIVACVPSKAHVVTTCSLDTLDMCLNDFGYQIVPKKRPPKGE